MKVEKMPGTIAGTPAPDTPAAIVAAILATVKHANRIAESPEIIPAVICKQLIQRLPLTNSFPLSFTEFREEDCDKAMLELLIFPETDPVMSILQK